MSETSNEQSRAIVPIAEVLPELRAEEYAEVRAWDEARMQLADGYERADGEYLVKIHAKLAPKLRFREYCDARNLPMSTAMYRIAKAEGKPYSRQQVPTVGIARLPEPTEPLRVRAVVHEEPVEQLGPLRIKPKPQQQPPHFTPEQVEAARRAVPNLDSGGSDNDNRKAGPARRMAGELADFRRHTTQTAKGWGKTGYEMPVHQAELDAWWRTVNLREWRHVVEDVRWFLDATKDFLRFVSEHQDDYPPMAIIESDEREQAKAEWGDEAE